MELRERIRRAVAGEVDRAEALLAEAVGAPPDERLLLYLGGWFRGLAAGLEELAGEVEALRQRPGETGPQEAPPFEPDAPREARAIDPDARLEQAERLQADAEASALPEPPA